MFTFQAFASFVIYPYYHLAYRIRGWGTLPRRRGPTLVIANHQHDLDDKVTITYLERRGPWSKRIYATTGQRLFDTGFMGYSLPWLEWLTRRFNATGLFGALGMVPIENQVRSRSVTGFAHAVYSRYGDLPIALVFRQDAIEPLGDEARDKTLSFLFAQKTFRRSWKTEVPIKAILEPYRSELIAEMRSSIARSYVELKALITRGETIWLTPEGQFTKHGRINTLRTALRELAPLADQVYVIGISYDAFVGRRWSMLFRIVLPAAPGDWPTSLTASRPVTVSQLVADWLHPGNARRSFSYADALAAVRARLAALPRAAWVEPDLRRSPERMTRAVLAGMTRLGILERLQDGYRLTGKRAHPQLPNVADIISHQAAFFEESCSAWKKLET